MTTKYILDKLQIIPSTRLSADYRNCFASCLHEVLCAFASGDFEFSDSAEELELLQKHLHILNYEEYCEKRQDKFVLLKEFSYTPESLKRKLNSVIYDMRASLLNFKSELNSLLIVFNDNKRLVNSYFQSLCYKTLKNVCYHSGSALTCLIYIGKLPEELTQEDIPVLLSNFSSYLRNDYLKIAISRKKFLSLD